MLNTYLNTSPLSKFVLIEDCLEHRGKGIVDCLVALHKRTGASVHYFTFEGIYKQYPDVICHDCVSNCKGWLPSSNDDFTNITKIKGNAIVVIDSLVHCVFQYGFKTVYRIIKDLLASKDILRIIAVYHDDLENTNILHYFQHLSTFSVTLQPNSDRVAYCYKKSSGKIIKQIEIYRIENGILKSEKIATVDPKVLVQDSLNPENLSTFKIGLNEHEKELRDKLILPYLYKEEGEKQTGEIFYEFDHTDDWDEEDPDDDLDI